MKVVYYLWFDDQQHGPYSRYRVHFEWTTRPLSDATWCWREGMSEWVPLEKMRKEIYKATQPIPFSDEFLADLEDELSKKVEEGRAKLNAMKRIPLIFLCATLSITMTACDEKPKIATQDNRLPPLKPLTATPEELDVFSAACDRILLELKTPSSARFSSPDDSLISHRPDDTWYVSGNVDSQNLHGAMVRNRWTLRMEYDAKLKRAVHVTDCLVY